MPGAHNALHLLTQGLRQHGAVLLAGVAQPHDELLTLVWDAHFDRAHALGLAAGQPDHAARTLPAVMQAADCFDALQAAAQRHLRRMILRHRAQAGVLHRPG